MNDLKKDSLAVSVIILSYNQREFLEKCIYSVLSQSHKPAQIIIVDNASTDTTRNYLMHSNLDFTLIMNESNLGFSKAMNRGLEQASGDYCLLLASDITIAGDVIKIFLDFAKDKDNVGILGGYVYNYLNQRLIFSGKKIALRWTFKQENLPQDDLIVQSDLIAGAFLFAKTKLVKRFKGFDERIFFYFEDLDLCLRIKKRGFRNFILPEAKAYHLEGDSGIKKYENNEKFQFELLKNIMLIYFKHAKKFWLSIFFFRYMFFGFIKNIFNKKKRLLAIKTRIWVLHNVLDLIKARVTC
jgi:GT2 family glycosyltransferase